jgi:hypothetical protein
MDHVSDVALADDALCAARDDGGVRCERLQQRSGGARTVRDVDGLSGASIVRVAQGDLSDGIGCSIASGAVLCWRIDAVYEGDLLGLSARRVSNLPPAAEIDVSADYACARTRDDAVACWQYPRPRAGGADDARLDASFVAGVHASAIVLGRDGTACALTTDGRVTCWSASSAPTDVPALAGAERLLHASRERVCALRGGSVACMTMHGGGRAAEVLVLPPS